MKLNDTEKQNSQRLNGWQFGEHRRLYSDPLQALKKKKHFNRQLCRIRSLQRGSLCLCPRYSVATEAETAR